MMLEWLSLADSAESKEETYADFFEQVLHVEQEARGVRSKEILLKFATGTPEK